MHNTDPSLVPNPIQETKYTLDLTKPYDNLVMTSKGTNKQKFIWGNDLISSNGQNNYYYLQDHLGSPIRLLGTESQDTALAYDEFGVPLVGTGENLNNPFGFTGYQMDNVANLYYAQARYYQPSIGRFISEDPAQDKLNWYNYCSGNPLSYIDPLGLCEEDNANKMTLWDHLKAIKTAAQAGLQTETLAKSVNAGWEIAVKSGAVAMNPYGEGLNSQMEKYNIDAYAVGTTIAETFSPGAVIALPIKLFKGAKILHTTVKLVDDIPPVTNRGAISETLNSKNPMFSNDWLNDLKTKYGASNVIREMPVSKELNLFAGKLSDVLKNYNLKTSEDVWKMKNPLDRGRAVEELTAATDYKDWYYIGRTQHGYFPVIDFQDG